MTSSARKPKRLTNEAVKAIVDLFSGKLKKRSPEATDAWRAVNWCHRNWYSVDQGIRVWLTNMTNPEMYDSMPMRLEVEANRKGIDRGKEREIAEYISDQIAVGGKKMSAYMYAEKKFGISYSKAEKIWSDWKPTIDMLNKRKMRKAVKK